MNTRGCWPQLTDAEIEAPGFLASMIRHNAKYCRGERREWARRVAVRLTEIGL